MSFPTKVDVNVHINQEQLDRIEQTVERIEENMATQADLDAAIAALPSQIQTAVDTALAPVIAAIKTKAAGAGVDLAPEIASLGNVGSTVATSVATDIAATG